MTMRLLKRARGRARTYPEPKAGDTFGVWRVVSILGRGHLGRSDLRIEILCTCGKRVSTYEFNVRKRTAHTTCPHAKRKRPT